MEYRLRISGNKRMVTSITLLLLVLSCIPQNIAYEFLDPVIKVFRYLALAWAFIILLATRIKAIKKNFVLFAFIGWILITTILNMTDLIGVFKLLYPIFTVIVLTQYILDADKERGIAKIAVFLSMFMLIQAISGLTGCFGEIYSGAWQGNYFFGIRVNVSFILPYALGLSLLYTAIDKKKGKFVAVVTIVSGVFFAFFELVSTAIMTIAVLFFTLYLMHLHKFKKQMLKPVIYFTIAFCAGFAFLGSNTDIFEWLLVGILHEDVTLDGRTILWEQAFDYLYGINWLIGYGYNHAYKFTISWWFSADHPHNEYVETLFCYGFVGIAIYFRILFSQFKNAWGVKQEKIMNIMIATLISVVVMHIASHNYMAVFPYIFYVTFANTPDILKMQSNN